MLKSRLTILSLVIALIAAGCAIWVYTQPATTNLKQRPVLSVRTVNVQVQPMPYLIQTIGTVEATQSATILPQITGIVTQINFQEGNSVKSGQTLIELDPTPLEITLQQVKATLQSDKAQLVNLASNAKRTKKLLHLGYASPQQYEQADASAKSQQAIVAADAQTVKQAETQLAYTKIKAPIDGKTGSVNVKIGDLVTANTTALLTINKLDPILINFSVSQSQLNSVLQYQKAGSLQVQIKVDSNKTLNGKLNFIDNTVNANTGTVAMKAAFANPDNAIWPGETVRTRLILTIQTDALVVPSSAIQIDQMGNFVYLLNKDTAKLQRIVVDRQLDGLSVISKGLSANDIILTDIPANLTDGAKVTIIKSVAGASA